MAFLSLEVLSPAPRLNVRAARQDGVRSALTWRDKQFPCHDSGVLVPGLSSRKRPRSKAAGSSLDQRDVVAQELLGIP